MKQQDSTYIKNLQSKIIHRVKEYEESKKKLKRALYSITTIFVIIVSISTFFYSNMKSGSNSEIDLNYIAEAIDDYDIYNLSTDLDNNEEQIDNQTIEYLSNDNYLEFYLSETQN
jgi:hypothetical protein